MSYVTGWRITAAADVLRDTSDTVETIARRVGYADAFALSVAFKRVRGTTPTAHGAPQRPRPWVCRGSRAARCRVRGAVR